MGRLNGAVASQLDMFSPELRGSLRFGVDDFNELGLEGGSAHQETVHVLLGAELLAGGPGHRACEQVL